MACLIFTCLNFFLGLSKNGPPDAVKKILSISFLSMPFNAYQTEKCSESTGINSVLYFFKLFLIKSHPHIIDSLLAIAIFFVYFIISSVGLSP